MVIKQVDAEQGLVEIGSGLRNIEQYDLLGYYDNELIASLWKDNEDNWHWTKRLYGLNRIIDMYCYQKDISKVIGEFMNQVTEWLNDEMAYLKCMYKDLINKNIIIEE